MSTSDCASKEKVKEKAETPPACEMETNAPRVGDEVRWKAGFSDIEFPPVPFPSRRLFAVAGEAKLRELVTRHHERLRDSAVGSLFPLDPEHFAASVARAADFVVENSGGPDYYAAVHGRVCMRTRHFPFTIDEQAREIWLAELLGAFDDVAFPTDIREEYWNWVEAMSIRMVNRRTMRAAPRRFPFDSAAELLTPSANACRPAVMCPR